MADFRALRKREEGAGAIGRVQHRTARSPQCRDCRGQEDGLRAGYDAAQAGGEDAHTRRTIFRYGKTPANPGRRGWRERTARRGGRGAGGQDEILSLDAGGTKAETASSGRTAYRGSGSFQSSTSAYRDINRTLGNFYEEPKEDPEKEALRKEVEELRNSMVQQHSIQPSYEEQVALLEKSYQLAAQYTSGENSAARETSDRAPEKADGKADIVPIGQVSVPVVSSLSQPMSDERILAGLSESRNWGFVTPVGTGGAAEKNTIRICVHGDQTVLNGQSVRLRLLEPMRAGNTLLPRNTLVTGTGRIQGDRLGIGIVSLEYGGLIIPVELTVYDSDGQEGIYIPNSAEVSAAKEVAANLGQNLGTSISITNQSAGDQLLSELGKGAIQGVSQYVSKKLREEKVHLKSGYTLMLSQKKNN